MNRSAYFDRRSTTYDQADIQLKVASLLVQKVRLEPGFRVLDIATGTGHVALDVAARVGSSGHVLGIDISEGMLIEARHKMDEADLRNVDFIQADAGNLMLLPESFDCVFCASALVLIMADIPQALRYWFTLLRPGGQIAFDMPAKPFGLLQRVANIAADYDVSLAFDTVADTPDKCQRLLEEAGFEAVQVRTELVSSESTELSEAIAIWDSRLDHPAWTAIRTAPLEKQEAIRADYISHIKAAAVGGYVPSDTALNLAFGRKPHPRT